MKNVIIGILTAALLISACYIADLKGRVAPPEAVPEKTMMTAGPSVGTHEQSRSGQWPKVRAEYLAMHPACEACGSTDDLQVHHVLQFRTHPDRELDLHNLICLCGPGGHNCHVRIGHSFRYFCENPHVREDAALQMKRIKERECD